MQNSLYKELSTLKLLTIYLKGLLELNVLNWYGTEILICGENLNFTLLIEGIYSTLAPVRATQGPLVFSLYRYTGTG